MEINQNQQSALGQAIGGLGTGGTGGGYAYCPHCAPKCPCCGRPLGNYGYPQYPYSYLAQGSCQSNPQSNFQSAVQSSLNSINPLDGSTTTINVSKSLGEQK